MRRLLITLVLVSSFCGFAAESVRTVILVRHAERAGGTDPSVGISEAGRCRAESLARMLADARVTAIYATEVKRTQQTAEPLAKKFGIQANVVPAKNTDQLVAQLRSSSNGTAVVVGHSNTVPEIIRLLGGGTVPPIADTEYDRMFVVTLLDAQHASVVTLHYPGCAQ